VSRKLRAGGFDAALVLPNSPRSALEAWLARIPGRLGYARPWRNWLLTRAVPERPGRVAMRKRTPEEIRRLVAGPPTLPGRPAAAAHQTHEYLHLAADAFGADPAPLAPVLCVSDAEVAAAGQKFSVTPGRLWLGLNPNAEYGPAKRWPLEHFAATVKAVQRRAPCHWLILGGSRDLALAGELEAGLRRPTSDLRLPPGGLINVAGQTSLRELMALLKLCRVVLTNDTGPMHLAAALGTPVVVPFGSTSPELTGPGLPGDPRHHLLRSHASCAPCFLRECPIDFRCLRDVSPAQAAAAVLSCLAA
jgi:heptosyltransferase-2